jgi:hypothetical protein
MYEGSLECRTQRPKTILDFWVILAFRNLSFAVLQTFAATQSWRPLCWWAASPSQAQPQFQQCKKWDFTSRNGDSTIKKWWT